MGEIFQITKTMIDLSTDGIFIMRNEIVRYANPILIKDLGYKLSEIIGTKITNFISLQELYIEHPLMAQKSRVDSPPITYETCAKLKNGKFIDVEISMVNVIFEQEQAVQVVLRDITKRKIAERKYRNIIDFAPIGFYQSARNGDFLITNNEMANILGFENKEELVSRNISEFYYSKEEREKLIKKYDTTTKSEVKNVEIKFRRKDGNPIWVLMTAKAIKDKDLNTISYDGFIINISDRKRKENVQSLALSLSKISFNNISLKEYLELIHNKLKEIMQANNFYVALYDKTTSKYTFPYCVDPFDEDDYDSPVFLDKSLTNIVREEKQGRLVDKKAMCELIKKNKIKAYGKISAVWLGVPLIDSSNNDAIGVLALQDYNNEKAYDKDDFETLEIIAANLGFFIERVISQEKLQIAKAKAEESEKRYKSLFYDNQSVMLLIDPITGKIVDANKSACHYYGYSYHQLTSLKIQEINTLSKKEVKEEMQKALNEVRANFNFKHQLANGEIKDVEVYSGSVNISGKDLLYSIVHDVTERKIAEEKVVVLKTSIEQSPISVIITNLKGIIEYVNPYYSEVTGYKRDELVGKNPNILKSGIHNKVFYKKLWDTILAGNKWQGEMRNKKKDGTLFWERAIISPIKNDAGKTTHFVGIKEDITERKKMIEELISSKRKAQESDRLKSAFLANMSHEIRTPMNGILGFSNLLLQPKLSDEKKDAYINIIHQSGERMLNTVNDIIEISKIESGIVDVKNSSFNLSLSISNIMNFFQPEAQKKGLTLSMESKIQEYNLFIKTDKNKFESIFTNLIKNAIKYTDQGKISVRNCVKGGLIEFCIEDTGIGIPADRIDAVFNRFEQADIEDTRAFQGSGLGLSIAKSYVEMLGGSIWVESIEGKGSHFYFTMPLSPLTEVPPTPIEIDNIENETSFNRKYKILIVEDDAPSLVYLEAILNGIAQEIVTAKTGEQAIEKCRSNSDFDIILMDIKLPGINGFESTKRIRDINKDVIIIAQTAYALSGDREKAIASGCNDYITKPVKKDILWEKIQKCLQQ